FLSESALSRGWLGQARRGGRGDPAPGNRCAAPRLSPHCRAAPVMIPMCAKRAAGNRRVRHGPPPLAATLVGILALLRGVGQPFVVARENARSSSSSLFVPDKGKLRILLDGQPVAAEEFDLSPAGAVWTARGSVEIKAANTAPVRVTATMRLTSD